jgi:glycerol kinase
LLTTAACGAKGERTFALEGSVFIAGAAVQWLRDGLGLITNAGETEALARSVTDTGGVHFVPAFTGLGSPHWEARARGTITGLTRGTTRAHLVRACPGGDGLRVRRPARGDGEGKRVAAPVRAESMAAPRPMTG